MAPEGVCLKAGMIRHKIREILMILIPDPILFFNKQSSSEI